VYSFDNGIWVHTPNDDNLDMSNIYWHTKFMRKELFKPLLDVLKSSLRMNLVCQ
jgi:hypothetical protein